MAFSPVTRLLVGSGLPAAFMVEFDVASFDLSLFARFGLHMPATILRSAPKRQAEFFFGRYCAALALAELGLPAREIPVGPSREPVWPDGVIGSITHTGAVAGAIAIPRNQYSGVGIDLERIIGVDERQALRSLVVNAAEFDYLESLAGALPMDVLLTIAFSAKESFFKAVFGTVRRHLDFDAVTIADLSPADGTVLLVLTESLSARLLKDQQCELRFRLIAPNCVLTSFVW